MQCRLRCRDVVVVATIMKPSRQEALCQQGLLHLQPVEGVMCFPLDAETPEHLQPQYEVLLVKATDFLQRTSDPEGGLAVAVSPDITQVRVVAAPLPHLCLVISIRGIDQSCEAASFFTG